MGGVIGANAWDGMAWGRRAGVTAPVGGTQQSAEESAVDGIAVGEVVVGDESVQGVVPGAGGDQQATAEQGHQRMGLLLETAGEGDAADLQMVPQGGEPGLDAGIDVLEIGLASVRQVRRSALTGQELQARGTGQGTAAGFDQQQMVVSAVPSVEVPPVSGAGELLPVGGLPQQPHRVSHRGETFPGKQMQLQPFDREQTRLQQFATDQLRREGDLVDLRIGDGRRRQCHGCPIPSQVEGRLMPL